ncbi:MAG TPA: hypothetical protein VFW65_13975 [Pseudonocardiaceae bacterium]|nr:hypothetical protein [Pseudonocardiaceae bacterium]
MPVRLKDLPDERANQLLVHPLHQDVFRSLVQLIHDLRQCDTYPEYRDFQEGLLNQLLEIDSLRGQCTRVRKRLLAGKPLPADAPELRSGADPTDVESWELEVAVCERGGRQLRSIGDALAWRLFNYDRRAIVALSRNNQPGLLSGKEGLAAERDFVAQHTRDDNAFVLLHDITSSLRIGDATLFQRAGDGWEASLYEIKSDPNRRRTPQLRRKRLAEEAVRNNGRLPGARGTRLVSVGLPYKTHLDLLRRAFELAADRGVQGIKVPGGRAVMAAELRPSSERWSEQEFAERAGRAYQQARRRAGIYTSEHHVHYMSDDMAARTPITPPWAIYPLPPLVCANLIADMAVFVVDISSEALVAALEDVGLHANWSIPPGQKELQQGQVVLRATNQVRGIELRPSEMQRLLLELMDLPLWAESVRRLLARDDLVPHPWPYFDDEWRVWA